MEELNLAFDESWAGSEKVSEVSEQDKQKVRDNSWKAAAVKKQIQADQKKNAQIAEFLSAIVKEFYDTKVIEELVPLLSELDVHFSSIKTVFEPILEQKYTKVSDYIDYLGSQDKLSKKYFKLILAIIKSEKVGHNWDSLKQNGKYDDFMESVKDELNSILS